MVISLVTMAGMLPSRFFMVPIRAELVGQVNNARTTGRQTGNCQIEHLQAAVNRIAEAKSAVAAMLSPITLFAGLLKFF